MGFSVEESGVIVTHLLYKAAVILAVLRWALSWALRFRNRAHLFSSSPSGGNDSVHPSQPLPSPQQIRDGLTLTTFAEITQRISGASDTCAVCLGQFNGRDEVRELRNCCHVFHRDCIDRWVDHDDHDDNRKACPLCRAPLLTTSQSLAWVKTEPSWAVERILYLFGDDLFD